METKTKWILFLLLSVFAAEMTTSCSSNTPPDNPSPAPTATPCSGLFGNNVPSGAITGGMLRLAPFTASSTPTLLTQLAVSIASGGTQYEIGLYAGSSAAPTTLVVETGAHPVTGTGWNRTTLSPGQDLAPGHTYWLGVYTDAVFGYTVGNTGGYHAIQSWSSFGSLPATFTGSPVLHQTMMCFDPSGCPPGIPIYMPTPGDVYCIWGTTCP